VAGDFPQLPDLQSAVPGLRALLENADAEARRHPGSAEAAGKLGMAYHANSYYQQAAAAYRIAAGLAPGDARWAYCRAFLQEEIGNEDAQFQFLEETLRLDSSHIPALIKMADRSFKLDRLDEAARYYEDASRVPGGGAELQAGFGLARVAARRQEWSKVVQIIVGLQGTYSYVRPPYELLQEAYQALGQPDKAAEAGRNLVLAKWKLVPPPEDPLNDQLDAVCFSTTRLLKHAGLLSRMGDPERALRVARRAAEVVPSDADVHNYIARTLLTFYGDKPQAIDEAMTHLGECLRLRPADPLPLGGFADEFFKTPKPPAAVERLQTLLLAHPDVPGIHFFLGMAADQLGHTAEAVAQYRAALKENMSNSAVYNKLGIIAENAGNTAEALANFRKAIEINPMNNSARLNLAIELLQLGRFDQGLAEIEALIKVDPHDPAAHFCKGFALLSMKRTDGAIQSLRRGLLYKPDDAEAHFGLGSALAAQGQREQAVAELREALRLRPDHAPARALLQQLSGGQPD
jgi:tetratricopeptide (TPR) repeat protein